MADLDVNMIRVIAAAFVLSIGSIGTAYAQAKIGTAVAAMLAERPENIGGGLVILALPETGLILSFVLALLILLGV